MSAETWLASRSWYQVRSLVGTNLDWWQGSRDLDLVRTDVEGFRYGPEDR